MQEVGFILDMIFVTSRSDFFGFLVILEMDFETMDLFVLDIVSFFNGIGWFDFETAAFFDGII